MAVAKVGPDQALDAERGVIGSMLISPEIARDVLARVVAEDFLTEANRQIFQAARALLRAGEPIDPMTIRDRLGADYTPYMMQLMEVTPTAANWTVYADLMHRQATLRRIRDLAGQLEGASTLDECRPLCADLTQLLADRRQVDAWTMREMLEDFFHSQNPDAEKPEYITTGLAEVDQGNYTELGDVLMIGGYPSDGKTALALMLAYHMAKKYKVGFFSLETDKRKVRDRMVSHMGQIDFGAIKLRALTEEDWRGLVQKSQDIIARDFTVIRGAGMTATEIQAVSQAYGFQIIFIDYVQLIIPEVDRRAPRSEQMADVSRVLHTFAQNSGTLVVELAQLTRPEKGGWREPDMHDLKESGQFEQDADMIYLLYRPDPRDDDLDQDQHRLLKIAKNKESRRGKWPLYFDGSKQTFSILVDPTGKSVLRSLVDAGKKAKKRSAKDPDQVTMAEIPDDGTCPF